MNSNVWMLLQTRPLSIALQSCPRAMESLLNISWLLFCNETRADDVGCKLSKPNTQKLKSKLLIAVNSNNGIQKSWILIIDYLKWNLDYCYIFPFVDWFEMSSKWVSEWVRRKTIFNSFQANSYWIKLLAVVRGGGEGLPAAPTLVFSSFFL